MHTMWSFHLTAIGVFWQIHANCLICFSISLPDEGNFTDLLFDPSLSLSCLSIQWTIKYNLANLGPLQPDMHVSKTELSGPADNFDVFISVTFTKYSDNPHNKCNYNGVR